MFLGVDGGGTKTAFCLLRRDGVIAGSALGPSTYANSEHLLGAVLRGGVSAVCIQAGIAPADLDYAFFGLPGYGEVKAAVPMLDRVPLEVLQHNRYTCDNDMVCGWAGSLGTGDGVNVISGTGSMAYGAHADRRARAGGWGETFGDEGSGHWIAIRGLAAFSRMSDGRTPRGPLYHLLREHLRVVDDFDVIDVVVNQWGGRRRDIATLAIVVVDAAAQADTCAEHILTDAAAELALVADACRRQLDVPPGETFSVSYSGGVFSADVVRHAFISRLHERGGYDPRAPLYPPVVGAALYAAKLAGTPLAADSIARLRSTTYPAGALAPMPPRGPSSG